MRLKIYSIFMIFLALLILIGINVKNKEKEPESINKISSKTSTPEVEKATNVQTTISALETELSYKPENIQSTGADKESNDVVEDFSKNEYLDLKKIDMYVKAVLSEKDLQEKTKVMDRVVETVLEEEDSEALALGTVQRTFKTLIEKSEIEEERSLYNEYLENFYKRHGNLYEKIHE